MKNVNIEVKGDKLILTVNLKEEHGLSGSGKNTIIGTTGGNVTVPNTNVKFGLNVYKSAK